MDTVVTRPDWVWDSRAPFHNFFQEHARFNRHFGSLIVTAEAGIYNLTQASNKGRAVRQTLYVDKGRDPATRAWMMYRRSIAGGTDKIDANRTPELFVKSIADAEQFVYQAMIVAYSSMFETYILCWSLNFLLASLEAGLCLANPARTLANTFARSPRDLNPMDALRAFPQIWEGLATLPHVFTDRRTGGPVDQPVGAELNAREVVRFWRQYRNHVVHRSRTVTSDFAAARGALWEMIRQPYRHVLPMRPGGELQFSDDLVRASFTVHYRAAGWLRNELVSLSSGKRGHVLAPEPPQDGFIVEPGFVPKPLLIDGDDPPSLRAVRATPQ